MSFHLFGRRSVEHKNIQHNYKYLEANIGSDVDLHDGGKFLFQHFLFLQPLIIPVHRFILHHLQTSTFNINTKSY